MPQFLDFQLFNHGHIRGHIQIIMSASTSMNSLKDLMNFTPQQNLYQQNLTSLSNNLPCDIFRHMIKTHVRKVAEKKGITTAYQLQKALDISPSVAARLWRDDFEFISRGSLNRLCKLLRCQPSKLITFELDK